MKTVNEGRCLLHYDGRRCERSAGHEGLHRTWQGRRLELWSDSASDVRYAEIPILETPEIEAGVEATDG